MLHIRRCCNLSLLYQRKLYTAIRSLNNFHTKSRFPKNVLIVGAGPVGMTLALLLKKQFNITSEIIDKAKQEDNHPRAHYMNIRTMEIYATVMPDLYQELVKASPPSEQWRHYSYCTNMLSGEIARVDQFGSEIKSDKEFKESVKTISVAQPLHLPQNKFEQILNNYMKKNNLEIQRGYTFEKLIQQDNGKQKVQIKTQNANIEKEYDFVIGADGAHSAVRDAVGVSLQGYPNIQSLMSIHFSSKELGDAMKTNPSMLYFIFNPKVVGVMIGHDIEKGEWVLQVPFFPLFETPSDTYTPQYCAEIIQAATCGSSNRSLSDIKIHSIHNWTMNAIVADEYHDEKKKVFFIGDAAHQFPPAGGFGMNTGIQDAYNLAWRLGYVMRGVDPSVENILLHDFSIERRQAGTTSRQIGLTNFQRVIRASEALGVSYNGAKHLCNILSSPLFKSCVPSEFQKIIASTCLTLGKSHLNLLERTSNPISNVLALPARKKLNDLVCAKKTIGLLFYQLELGYLYGQEEKWQCELDALLFEKNLNYSNHILPLLNNQSSRNYPQLNILAINSMIVGRRLPHFWIRNSDHHRLSTLNLTEDLRGTNLYIPYILIITENSQLEVTDYTELISSGRLNITQLVDNHRTCKTDPNLPQYEIEDKKITEYLMQNYQAILIRPDGHINQLWTRTDRMDHNMSTVEIIKEKIGL